MQKFNLNGIWKLYYFPQDKYNIVGPADLDNLSPIECVVPGNVEIALMNAGELPEDIYFGENTLKLRPYELYEWWYEREFETPHGIQGKDTDLVFQGVDCLATYWLNGERMGSSENMFIEHCFRVSGRLNATKKMNKLTIRLRSPIHEVNTKTYDPISNIVLAGLSLEQIWIRKAAHSYGWDIMPRILSAGLWKSVDLVIREENEITDIYFNTISIESGKATLRAHFDGRVNPELLSDLYIRIAGNCGDSTFHIKEKVFFKAGTVHVEIENPKLWWPRGYGKAYLYQTSTQWIWKDTVIAERNDTFGIRTVELLSSESTSTENPGQFLFKINNTPILCKGSNWVPADALHSRDAARYEKILELFDNLNCNIIRCWGGNVYEDHKFFDLCNQYGFMVWQDFAMACAQYPQKDEFYKMIREEVVSVVRKLRNHPSIVLWSGDNECDMLAYYRGFDPNRNKITREVIPQAIYAADPYRPYLASSPYYSPAVVAMKDLKLMPEDHLWGPRDYYKSSFYTESPAHFVSEIGYHGCPNISSICKFIDGEHVWPWKNNSQWNLHSSDQNNNPYRVKLMADQINELFGFCPDKIEDFVVASQISQAEAKKFFIEMTRLKKWNRTGVIWWNLMDGWPQFSDAVVDYYYGKKLAYHYIKRVQQPVCIMISEPNDWCVKAVAGNDSNQDMEGNFRIWDANSGETLLEGRFMTRANTNTGLGEIRISRGDKRLFLIEWDMMGAKYGNHYLLGYPPFSFEQYRKWLEKIANLDGSFNAAETGK